MTETVGFWGTLQLVKSFLLAVPQMFKLLQILQQAALEAQIQGKAHEDLKTITNAFATGDDTALNDLFLNRTMRAPAAPAKTL